MTERPAHDRPKHAQPGSATACSKAGLPRVLRASRPDQDARAFLRLASLAPRTGSGELTVQMTVDQRAAIGAFEDLGFRAEAVLRKQVKDREGNAHDLVLSHDVAAGQSLMQVFGQSEALQG